MVSELCLPIRLLRSGFRALLTDKIIEDDTDLLELRTVSDVHSGDDKEGCQINASIFIWLHLINICVHFNVKPDKIKLATSKPFLYQLIASFKLSLSSPSDSTNLSLQILNMKV